MTNPVPAAGAAPAQVFPQVQRIVGMVVIAISLVLLLGIPQFFPDFVDGKTQQNWLSLFAKFMALAILALSVDLVWGYTGLLSLGQGVFFGIGAYMIAYCLTLDKAAADAKPQIVDGPPKMVTFSYNASFPPQAQQILKSDGHYRIEAIRLRVIKPAPPGAKGLVSRLPFNKDNPDPTPDYIDRFSEYIHKEEGAFNLAAPAGIEQTLVMKGGEKDDPKDRVMRKLERVGDMLYFEIAPITAKGEGEITVVLVGSIEEHARPGDVPPQFMQYTGFAPQDENYVAPPVWVIAPLANRAIAITACVFLPTLVAALFGLVIFRLRVKGVYFALVTQAFLLAVFTLVRNQQRFTGGVVGIKDMSSLHVFGLTFDAADHVRETVYLVAAGLLISFVLCVLLVNSKFGKILTAIRDNENRVLALGYNTAIYKTYLFAFAGLLAGVAGGLYVLGNHPVCDSDYLSVPFSIQAVIWVALGGRSGLLGAVLGALLLGFGQYYIQSALPDYWPIVLGLIFIFTVLYLPRGLAPVSGSGSLLGLLFGIFLLIYLENKAINLPVLDWSPPFFWSGGSAILHDVPVHKGSHAVKLMDAFDAFLGYPKAGRIYISCPLLVLCVFLPRVVSLVGEKVVQLFQLRPENTALPLPAAASDAG